MLNCVQNNSESTCRLLLLLFLLTSCHAPLLYSIHKIILGLNKLFCLKFQIIYSLYAVCSYNWRWLWKKFAQDWSILSKIKRKHSVTHVHYFIIWITFDMSIFFQVFFFFVQSHSLSIIFSYFHCEAIS